MDFSSLKLKEKEYRLTGEEARKYLDEKAERPAPTQSAEPKRWTRGLLTGAFDLFHVAHAKAIDKASSLCDQLIVAVSTDEVIRHYKGEPFQPFQQRLETVSYCKGVTLAIPQDDLYEKLEMCEALGVDVLFSCEEYQRSYYPDPEKMTPKEIAGVERWEKFEAEVNAHGIDVVYLPRSQEVSSSMLKARMFERSGYQEQQGIMLYSEGEDYSAGTEATFSL